MTEAAESLGVTGRRVRALIASGKLRALRVGGRWMIGTSDLNNARDRKPGRPKTTDVAKKNFHRRQDWRTPRELFQALHEEFSFTLDAAASHENALLPRYFTVTENGLEQSWKGHTVFLNCPFVHTSKWVRKALSERDIHGVTTVMLLPARPGNKIWQEVILPQCEVRFLPGRINFDEAEYAAPFDVALVIFRVRT